MNRNALVIHGNKCTSSIFIFILRFSVDFLWIGVSKWTVRFSLCLEQTCVPALASHLATVPTLWFTWNDLESISIGSFFALCTAEKSFLTCSFIQIIGLKYCQTLMKKPKRLRLDSLVLSKEGLPVCPRAAAWHGSALGRAAHTTPPGPGCWCSHHTGCRRMAASSSEIKTTSRFLP